MPPRRALLGSDAYRFVAGALEHRLSEARAGEELARTTDVDGWTG